MRSLGIFLQVFHVVSRVTAFQKRIGGGALLLTLPKEVSAQRLGQLGREHVAAGGTRRMGD